MIALRCHNPCVGQRKGDREDGANVAKKGRQRRLRRCDREDGAVGVEGATMARGAPFPLSSIPAYIEKSMKLFVSLSGAGDQTSH